MTIRNGMMAALCAGVLVLTLGCGGGGDDGAQRDLQAQVDMLMVERDAALQAEVAAEAAKAAAEAAQATAEMERDNANVAKGAAEELMRVAQQAQEDAETARQAAEDAKTAADMAQQGAETARDAALKTQTQAEDDLAAANASKTMTEGDLAMVRQQLADANTELATANANLQAATQNLDTANDNLAKAEQERDAAKTAENQAKIDLARVEGELAGLQRQLGQAEQDTERAEERTRQAEQETQRVTQQVDADARARGLLTALNDVLDGSTWKTPGNMASAEINDRQTDIELTASPLEGSTRKSGDFYTATLRRTAPGVTQPEHKVVAYTDREKSRTFANHYATSIDSEVGGTTSNPRFVNSVWVGDLRSLPIVSNPSRGGHPSTIATDPGTDPDPRPVSSLSARVRGVSGSYGCYNKGTSEACDVMVTATYAQEDGTSTTSLELATLTIAAESNGTLYFDPGSGTISLLGVEKSGAPAVTDEQYITFGWWIERPALSDGTYEAAVFAGTTGAYTGTLTGSADYEGPAVGLYVDRTSEGGTTVYESGDFTATTILRATFTGTDTGVQGDVTNFRTTHGTKNWHVRLNPTSASPANATGTAEIVQAGTSSEGMWERTFLARHGMVDEDDEQPIAVTGRFDVSIPNLRHIVGAFGAHRTTDPIGQ